MDELDSQIIQLLKRNAKLTYKKIAKLLDTPPSTIHFRIKKLLEEKIIVRFSSIIDVGKLGYETVGWVGISTDPLKTDEIAKQLSPFKEVRMISSAGGTHNLITQILVKNEKELWNFVRKNIQTIEGVQNIDVSSSLKVFKWNTCYFFSTPKI